MRAVNPRESSKKPPQQYSSYFHTIYEELEENGVGYSVMRAKYNGDVEDGATFNFVIAWDEYGRDVKRVIPELERLYHEGKLLHYMILGKRKALLYAVLNPSKTLNEETQLGSIETHDGDYWDTNIREFDGWRDAPFHISYTKYRPFVDEWSLGEISFDEQGLNDLSTALEKNLKLSDPYCTKTVKHVMPMHGLKKVSFYGFQDPARAREMEQHWQRFVIEKFFRIRKPLKPGKLSHKMYNDISQQLQGNPKPYQIDGMCRRSFIIALSKVLSEQGKIPNLTFQIGPTIIHFKESPEISKKRQRGNFMMDVPGIYAIKYGDGCLKRINTILNTSYQAIDPGKCKRRHDNLLEKFNERLVQIIPFAYSDFNQWGNIKVDDEKEATQNDNKAQESAHFLNGLLMLITVVEVVVRLYRTSEGHIFSYRDPTGFESDNFPVAIAQARSLLLLIKGEISFEDFIGQSKKEGYNGAQHRAYFGVVTGQNTMDNIRLMFEKLLAINTTFDEYNSKYPFWSEFRAMFLNKNEGGALIPGRTHIADDLRLVYGSGGESDTDDSDYSDTECFHEGEVLKTPQREMGLI